MSINYIEVRGAKEHNLKNIDVKIPIDKLTVITGLSGSGKSSLAFDTLYAEGQRRYVESLSAYARQFLGIMNKPDVEKIIGLSPAISIEQKSVSKNPRSTVGTITEIHDYLRLLFARIGRPYCPQCGKLIMKQSSDEIVKNILSEFRGKKIQVLAPIIRGKKGTYEKLFEELHKDGYFRIRVDNEILELDSWKEIQLNKQIKHTIEVIIDRISVKKDFKSRLTESVENALSRAEGLVSVEQIEGKDTNAKTYSEKNACADCGLSFGELEPRMFSFNSPFGACSLCHGLGLSQEVDLDLVIPDRTESLGSGAIRPWRNVGDGWRNKMLEGLAKHYNFDIWTPFEKLSKDIQHIVLHGSSDTHIHFEMKSWERDSKYTWTGGFEGVIPQLERLYKQTESEWRRDEIAKYMRTSPCRQCSGKRLKVESLSVLVGEKNIWEMSEMPIDTLLQFSKNLKLSDFEKKVAELIFKEIVSRLTFLRDVGLEYLTLSRPSGTLAGGESQRIRLATQIGSELRGVLYILDEPSIGLHQRDNRKLIETLQRLRDIGNTVLVVEHDAETILNADYVVDLGPGAGVHGGEIVAAGTPKEILKNKKSLTGQYLSGEKFIPFPEKRRKAFDFLELIGAQEHNLKNISVKFPLGVMCCVSGVSGSGKSTLVNDILYTTLHKIFWATSETPGKRKAIKGYGYLNNVVIVDQSPIGRTPRSNPATYIGVFTHIRELFAATPDAKARGYKVGRFSFNVSGGRCEDCEGDGVKKIEMHFLADIYIECQTCKGKRYNEETLKIRFKNKNISDVLAMSVEEALEFFENIPRINGKLQTLCDVGLGYIALGQSATTLSGGEAQRIKLTSELSRKGGKVLYILDEPTTGLHFDDVKKLLEVLNRLVDKGNSVLVIEHNLDVLKSADWIIDLGPDGGYKGGRVVAEGTPERIAKSFRWSYTGKFLKEVFDKIQKKKK